MFALLDYRIMLKFMTLRLADSAASRARGWRFSFEIRGTNCGILYWKLGRHLGLFILSLQHLTSEHLHIPCVKNGRESAKLQQTSVTFTVPDTKLLSPKPGFAESRPAAHGSRRPGGPVAQSSFQRIHTHAQICIGFGRAKWTTVSLKSFTI